MAGNENLAKEVSELKEMVKAQNRRIDQLIKHIKEGCEQKPEPEPPKSTMCNMNPYIDCLIPDILYHLNMCSASMDFEKMFGDVRFVCMGGTPQRMEKIAVSLMKEIGLKMNSGVKLKDLSEHAHRFALFKVGPVLCASHAIGGPSISILLHELIKLLHHAKAQNPIFFRLGTSGGIGIAPGTVIITSEALDGQLRPVHEVVVHGKVQLRPSILDQKLAIELKSMADACNDGFETLLGKTCCTNDFYEGQSRLDGAFCDYTPEKKIAYLKELSDKGVLNIEMESTTFAAMTHQACIRSSVLAVAILNRMKGDQIIADAEILRGWMERPMKLVARYMRKVLYGDGSEDDEHSYCHCNAEN